MALIFTIEQRLVEWGRWRRSRSGDDTDAPEAAAVEVERAVGALPSPLRETVEQCYVQAAGRDENCARLGCPHWTVSRRLGRAHLMLRDSLPAAPLPDAGGGPSANARS